MISISSKEYNANETEDKWQEDVALPELGIVILGIL